MIKHWALERPRKVPAIRWKKEAERVQQEAEKARKRKLLAAYQRLLAAYKGPPPPIRALALVLDRLRHNPALLATCMRVSPDFYSIAGTLLYSTVTIPDRRCGHWDCEDYRPCRRELSISAVYTVHPLPEGLAPASVGKLALLQGLRGIELRSHDPEKCTHERPDLDGSTHDWAPEWVRVHCAVIPYHRKAAKPDRSIARSCPLIEWFGPKKLVYTDQWLRRPFPIHQRVPRSVNKLVTVVSELSSSCWQSVNEPSRMSSVSEDGGDWLSEASDLSSIRTGDNLYWPKWSTPPATYAIHPSVGMLDHLVFVFYSRDLHGSMYIGYNSGFDLETFYDNIFQTIRQVRPRKVTIVNPHSVVDALRPRASTSGHSEDLTAVHTRSEPDCCSPALWDDPSNIPRCMADPSTPIELEVLGLAEYLQKYDWFGEFDETMVQPWLDAVNRQPPRPHLKEHEPPIKEHERSQADRLERVCREWEAIQQEPKRARMAWSPRTSSTRDNPSELDRRYHDPGM